MWLKPDAQMGLAHEERSALLDVADAAIGHGLAVGVRPEIDATRYAEALQEARATFVTLRVDGSLKGCMGSLTWQQPLVMDVAWNAYSAAFSDPRFAGLSQTDYERLSIQISVLNQPEPIEFRSESELIALIRPGLHGLTLFEGEKRGTLLPSVWSNVPDPRQFLIQLKRKAGLPADYWSATIRVECYTTECFDRTKCEP